MYSTGKAKDQVMPQIQSSHVSKWML